MDFCTIVQGFTIRMFADCNAIFHLCDHRNAGTFKITHIFCFYTYSLLVAIFFSYAELFFEPTGFFKYLMKKITRINELPKISMKFIEIILFSVEYWKIELNEIETENDFL